MKKFGVMVIGSGCGLNIVDEALAHGFTVALVDKGPPGGTCPNLGCIPSKMLIYPADVIAEAQDARKLGVEIEIKKIDFKAIMARMKKIVLDSQEHIREGLKYDEKLDYYEGEGHFTGPYSLEVNGEEISAEIIIIASGSRPTIPPIKGLDGVAFLTSDTVLDLVERPASLIIIGGGYVAVEYGHFFAAMGTRVTILEMADRLVLSEEPEISELLKKELSKRVQVFTGVQVSEVQETKETVLGDFDKRVFGMQVTEGKKTKNGVIVTAVDSKTGERRQYEAQALLVATGRRSNADILKVANAGVEVDSRGYVRVDEYLETTKKNIYCVGDANGTQMFTHIANREAAVAAHNALHEGKMKMDYTAAPHAVYSHPQIASVGLREAEARKQRRKILIGRAQYTDVATGDFMMEENGFAKAIVAAGSEKILGFHIIGPYAPILIQEVIDTMTGGGTINHIMQGLHIHPSPPELIQRTLANLAEK